MCLGRSQTMRLSTVDLLFFLVAFTAFLVPSIGALNSKTLKLIFVIQQDLVRPSGTLNLHHAGIVLTQKWVLTATHTFKDYIIAKNNNDLTSIKVTVKGVDIPIDKVFFHPNDGDAMKAKTAATFEPKKDCALLESEKGAFGKERFSLVVDIIPEKAKDECYAVGFGKSPSDKLVSRKVTLVTSVEGCQDFVKEFKEFPDDEFRAAASGIKAHHVCTEIADDPASSVAESGGPLVCELPNAGALAFGLAHSYLPAQRVTTFVHAGALERWLADRTGAPQFVEISSCPDRKRPAIGGLICLFAAFWLH